MGWRQVEQGLFSFIAKNLAKNEEKPCSTCLPTHFSANSGYPKSDDDNYKEVVIYVMRQIGLYLKTVFFVSDFNMYVNGRNCWKKCEIPSACIQT